MLCRKCEEVISPKKNAPRCGACKRNFHGSTCVPVAVGTWKKWGNTRRRVWQCPPCKEISDNTEAAIMTQPENKSNSKSTATPKSTSSKKSVGTSSQPSVRGKSSKSSSNLSGDIALLTNLGLDIDMAAFEDASLPTSTKNLNVMMMYLVREVSSINNKFEKLNAEVNQLKATVQILSEENKALKRHRKQSDERHRIGDYQRRLLNDYSRVDNLVLHGGPKATTPEQSFELFQAAAAAYGITLDPRDVSVCHPLPSKGTVNKQICRFSKRGSKIKLFLASKKRRLTSRLLGWSGVEGDRLDDPVFITEHLSPDTARLLAEAKKKLSVAANGPYTHVWCRQGRVLVRCEGDRGRPIEVCHFTDIAEIYKEAVNNGFVPKSASTHPEPTDRNSVPEGQHSVA